MALRWRSGRVGHRRVALSHVSCTPSSNRTCGLPASGSPIIVLPAACAASQVDGSLSLPFDTADTVCTGTDSSSASGPTANCIGVCVGAITAARSVRPSRSGGRSGCCSRLENRYTTHSEPDATSESPHRPRRYWETIAPLRAPDPGYVDTPSCAATCIASVSGVSETRNPETRNPLPPWSAGSSPWFITNRSAANWLSRLLRL